MYTIVQTSGKQFLFRPKYWYDLDYIKVGDLGDFIYLKKILLLKKQFKKRNKETNWIPFQGSVTKNLPNKIQLGKPFLEKSKVVGKILQDVKGKKITVLKTKPKKNYTKTQGHRQLYTRVNIEFDPNLMTKFQPGKTKLAYRYNYGTQNGGWEYEEQS